MKKTEQEKTPLISEIPISKLRSEHFVILGIIKQIEINNDPLEVKPMLKQLYLICVSHLINEDLVIFNKLIKYTILKSKHNKRLKLYNDSRSDDVDKDLDLISEKWKYENIFDDINIRNQIKQFMFISYELMVSISKTLAISKLKKDDLVKIKWYLKVLKKRIYFEESVLFKHIEISSIKIEKTLKS